MCPEIKSSHSESDIIQYAQDNQLDILNTRQIAAKFLELETRIISFEDFIEKYI